MTRWLITAAVTASLALTAQLVAVAAGNPYPMGSSGYDVSYPQCSGNMTPGGSFGVIGVTGGRPFTLNGCRSTEYAEAPDGTATGTVGPSLYFNTGYSGAYQRDVTPSCASLAQATVRVGRSGQSGHSSQTKLGSTQEAFAIGCSEAAYAVSNAPGPELMWWLDVETGNSWSSANLLLNQNVIQGAVSYLSSGHLVGVYSTATMWKQITGSTAYSPNGISGVWLASSTTSATGAASMCSDGFAGAASYLVQYARTSGGTSYDADYAC